MMLAMSIRTSIPPSPTRTRVSSSAALLGANWRSPDGETEDEPLKLDVDVKSGPDAAVGVDVEVEVDSGFAALGLPFEEDGSAAAACASVNTPSLFVVVIFNS